MTTSDEDIFGQIDALLGKRSPAVLTEKNLQGDDFPMLTEVIKTNIPDSQENMESNQISMSELNSRQVERRVLERRQGASSESSRIIPGAIHTPALDALESRLIELLRSHHATLENSLRSIIQEELNRIKLD